MDKINKGEKQRAVIAAYGLIALAAVLYGIMPSLIKSLYTSGLNGISVHFYESLFAIPMFLIWSLVKKVPLTLTVADAKKYLALGSAEALTTIALFSSYSFIPVGTATMLHFIFPIAVAFISARLFHWQRDLLRGLILCGYMVGIILLSAAELQTNFIGITLAFSSGLIWAVFTILLTVSGVAGKEPCVFGFYKYIVCAAITWFAGAVFHAPFAVHGWTNWLSLVIYAFLFKILCGSCYQLGARHLSSFVMSIISTLEPIVAVLVGCVFFKEVVVGAQWIGVALVMAAIVGIPLNERRSQKTNGKTDRAKIIHG